MGWDKKEWSFWLAFLLAVAVFAWFRGKEMNQVKLSLVPHDQEVPK